MTTIGCPMTFPWIEFIGLMLAFAINAVIPGADFAMVLRQAIAHDRRAALFTSAGIAASILVHGSYTLLGIGVIVGQSLLLFNVLNIGTCRGSYRINVFFREHFITLCR